MPNAMIEVDDATDQHVEAAKQLLAQCTVSQWDAGPYLDELDKHWHLQGDDPAVPPTLVAEGWGWAGPEIRVTHEAVGGTVTFSGRAAEALWLLRRPSAEDDSSSRTA